MSIFHHEGLYRSAGLMMLAHDLKVTICGAGALGGTMADHLARTGFAHITVIDRDRVEERNLSMGPYFRGDIGGLKATILANSIYRAVGTTVEAIAKELTAENAGKMLRGSGLVLDLFVNSIARSAVTGECAKQGIPCLHVGLAGDYAEIIWNREYRVPSAAQDDICDYPLARNLVMMAVAVAGETVMEWLATGLEQSQTVTLRDFAIRPFNN
ncbi:MAG: thiamine biosynthesis protein ThiF [Chlorobi bacterium]|nr:thiamine biosynthesis protein ThiF [Chlorobiota bacterium]